MKFITCLVKGWQALVYRELLNPYDTAVWVIGTTSGLGVAYMVGKTSHKNLSLYRKVVSIFMAFTEQGDPFTIKTFQQNSAKVVVATYLLMTVVLSNAYKTTNVYNMILPRFPTSYKNFQQLQADDFGIYVRARLRKMEVLGCKCRLPFQKLGTQIEKYTHHETRGGAYGLSFTLEMRIMSELLFLSDLLRKNEFHKASRDFIKKTELLNGSRMHPNILNMTLKTFDALNKSRTIDPRKEIEILEEVELMQTLKLRDKYAVIAPFMTVTRYLATLKRNNVTTCHIGEETFGKVGTGFRLVGLIPPYLILRLRIIQENGVWEWWEQLIIEIETKEGDVFRSERQKVKKATLDRNIFVIFTIVLVGSLLRLVYLMELGKSIGFAMRKLAAKIITVVKDLNRMFWKMLHETTETPANKICIFFKGRVGRWLILRIFKR